MELTPELLQLIHLAATLFMTGAIWFVQVVHYPLFSAVGRSDVAVYASQHAVRTTWIVAPPMLVELVSALLLFWIRPTEVSTQDLSMGLSLLAVIWISTVLVQVPSHTVLQKGFDVTVHRRLVRTNWVRTIAWSLRDGERRPGPERCPWSGHLQKGLEPARAWRAPRLENSHHAVSESFTAMFRACQPNAIQARMEPSPVARMS